MPLTHNVKYALIFISISKCFQIIILKCNSCYDAIENVYISLFATTAFTLLLMLITCRIRMQKHVLYLPHENLAVSDPVFMLYYEVVKLVYDHDLIWYNHKGTTRVLYVCEV